MDNMWPLLSKLSSAISSFDNNCTNGNVFIGLQKYCERFKGDEKEVKEFFLTVKAIAKYATNLEVHLAKERIKVLRYNKIEPLVISCQLVAGIIAHSFFCLHIKEDFNFKYIYASIASNDITMHNMQSEKLKCILKYFFCLEKCNASSQGNLLTRKIKFQRQVLVKQIQWEDLKHSDKTLGQFTVEKSKSIESTSKAHAKVIFLKSPVMGANILRNDGKRPIYYQEEMFILSCPELLLGLFLLDPLRENEAITITNFKQFTDCSRINGQFFCQNIVDGPDDLTAIAINATNYATDSPDKKVQYQVDYMLRDFKKAYAGFMACRIMNFDRNSRPYQSSHTKSKSQNKELKLGGSMRQPKAKTSVPSSGAGVNTLFETSEVSRNNNFPTSLATGSWGCGSLGGDPQLKAMLQWIAMTEAECKEMIYCTMDDVSLDKLEKVKEEMKNNTVAELANFLENYAKHMRHSNMSLFEFWEKNKKKKKCIIL